MKIDSNGFIQIPIIIIGIAILVFGVVGYFGVKQYQNNTKSKTNSEVIVEDSKTADTLIADTEQIIELTPVEKEGRATTSANIIDIAKKEETNQQKEDNAKLSEVLEKITDPQKQLTEAAQVINEFLSNPSMDNFRVFCVKAKDIKSSQTKEVLSADRTKMETINKTLFEAINTCHYLTDPDSGFLFVSNLEDLLVDFDDIDTDSVRTKKISYNDQINELDHQYKIYSYNPCGATSIEAYFQYVFAPTEPKGSLGSIDPQKNYCYGYLVKSIKIPEIEIRNVLESEK